MVSELYDDCEREDTLIVEDLEIDKQEGQDCIVAFQMKTNFPPLSNGSPSCELGNIVNLAISGGTLMTDIIDFYENNCSLFCCTQRGFPSTRNYVTIKAK